MGISAKFLSACIVVLGVPGMASAVDAKPNKPSRGDNVTAKAAGDAAPRLSFRYADRPEEIYGAEAGASPSGARQAFDPLEAVRRAEQRAQKPETIVGPAPEPATPAPSVSIAPLQERALPAPAPASVEPRQTPPAPAVPRAKANAGYYLQLGSFSEIDNARRARATVGETAPVHIKPATVKGAQFFRVLVGPWGSRDEALRQSRQIRTIDGGAPFVVALNP